MPSLQELSNIEMDLATALGHNSRTGNELEAKIPRVTTASMKEGAKVTDTEIPLEVLLTMAKELGNTMGAPPSWQVGTPMIGFVPPAPFPFQIRGGILNNLELNRLAPPVQTTAVEAKPENSEKADIKEEGLGSWKPGDALQLSAADIAELEAAAAKKEAEKKRKRDEKGRKKKEKEAKKLKRAAKKKGTIAEKEEKVKKEERVTPTKNTLNLSDSDSE
ncbi:hypothetical protein TrST_g8558 [Triparma strigata]|uniref:Mediator complex subunit 4 n=1 Tax=Triparma strigata TaxID=1606541 RepID=A0A9W7EI26_9STRA|nr:hypothetical protein TrST_g8558 [Triparma strigata]